MSLPTMEGPGRVAVGGVAARRGGVAKEGGGFAGGRVLQQGDGGMHRQGSSLSLATMEGPGRVAVGGVAARKRG